MLPRPYLQLPLFLLLLIFSLITTAVAQDLCFPETCADPENDNFFSFHECCGDECCHKFRFWVIPGSIAAVGFFGGAFFALCFQCR